jgi:hypothetical protein
MVDYPKAGIVPNDIVDIPAQAIHASRLLRMRVSELYVVPNYPLVALTGEDVVVGKQLTVWLDPAWVYVLPPPRSGDSYVVSRAAS